MNNTSVAEDELEIRIYSEMINASKIIKAIRHIKRTIELNIDNLSPSDSFILQLIRTGVIFDGYGSHTKLPEDVSSFFDLVRNLKPIDTN